MDAKKIIDKVKVKIKISKEHKSIYSKYKNNFVILESSVENRYGENHLKFKVKMDAREIFKDLINSQKNKNDITEILKIYDNIDIGSYLNFSNLKDSLKKELSSNNLIEVKMLHASTDIRDLPKIEIEDSEGFEEVYEKCLKILSNIEFSVDIEISLYLMDKNKHFENIIKNNFK